MASHHKKMESGFTFIEIIATLMIVEVISLAILGMFAFSNRSTKIVRDSLIRTNVFQYKVEEIKTKEFSKNVSGTAESIPAVPGYTFNVFQTDNFLGLSQLKKVDITCFWTSPFGGSRSETMSILISDHL